MDKTGKISKVYWLIKLLYSINGKFAKNGTFVIYFITSHNPEKKGMKNEKF